jgi:hypothetical protein
MLRADPTERPAPHDDKGLVEFEVPTPGARPALIMSRPRRFFGRMLAFVAAVTATAGLLFSPVTTAFAANPALNGLIIGILLIGIVYIFRQVLMLGPEIKWIEEFDQRLGQTEDDNTAQPDANSIRLLAPMATMLAENRGKISLSALALRSLLDTVGARLDESRDISRYLIGLLIFLGLLGTFWGLLQTVSAIGAAIGAMSVESGDFATLFSDLQAGLEAPLAGMGTAFSSSLFGLAGSLVLGFLDLQASQAQNRFYNDLEDWLSAATRLSSSGPVVEGDGALPAYVGALLERSAEGLDNLQRAFQRSEEGRLSTNESVVALSERLATLTDQMRAEQNLMVKLAQSQVEMKPILDRLATTLERQQATDGGSLDDASRTHLRNLDVLLTRLVEDQVRGRQQLIDDLRSEIKMLARTVAGVQDGDQPEG